MSHLSRLLPAVVVALLAAVPAARAGKQCESDRECSTGELCTQDECQTTFCPQMFAPVCGVDGTTYTNACFARLAHVAVAQTGPCGGPQPTPLVPCSADSSCGQGTFCEHLAGTCKQPSSGGFCVPKPETCTFLYAPVCGCDGKTYPNDCVRRKNVVSLAHSGACPGGPSPLGTFGGEKPFPWHLAGGDKPLPWVQDPQDPTRLFDLRLVRGTLEQGAECRVLRTAKGKLYSLLGNSTAFKDGAEVCVAGLDAQTSFCMQGQALQVVWITTCPAEAAGGK